MVRVRYENKKQRITHHFFISETLLLFLCINISIQDFTTTLISFQLPQTKQYSLFLSTYLLFIIVWQPIRAADRSLPSGKESSTRSGRTTTPSLPLLLSPSHQGIIFIHCLITTVAISIYQIVIIIKNFL